MQIDFYVNLFSTGFFMPCENWHEPQHILFQLAYGCFFISCLTPDNSIGILVMHAVLLLGIYLIVILDESCLFFRIIIITDSIKGGLLYSTWAWNMMCAPDIFSWTFGFVFLNFCQLLYDLYRIRPVRLDPEVEAVFALLFQPLGVK
jgi:hypothetical protein